MCTEKYINPFTDFGFKRLFGSEHNKDLLISFLNSIIENEKPIVDLTYGNVEKLGMLPQDRSAIFDIYCETDDGSHFIVEMQNVTQRYFIDRSIYYSMFPIMEAAKAGDWDFHLPKIYTVAILNFRLASFAESADFKHVVRLCDEKGEVFSDRLTYIYLEMPKFTKSLDELESISDKWLFLLNNINRLDSYPPRIKEKIFDKFFKIANITHFSHQELQAYELSLKYMRDFNNTVRTAEENGQAKGFEKGLSVGREEGLSIGREEERKRVIEALRKMGMSEDTIGSILE